MAYPGGPAPHLPDFGLQPASTIGDGPPYAAAYESLTFPYLTRGRRELSVTLAAQPVFDLIAQRAVSRRVRRIIRHKGGERALLGRRTLEPADLRRIDLLTLGHGLDLLRLNSEDSGVLPAFWRTAATSHGRFALLYAGLQHQSAPAMLLLEIMGGPEVAGVEALAEAIGHLQTERLNVILHVAPDADLISGMDGTGAHCLAIDFAGVDQTGARGWEEATRLIAAARQAATQVLILNLRPESGPAAAAAGATHAVFAPMESLTV